MVNIVVYGTGKICNHFLNCIGENVNIISFAETRPSKEEYMGYDVIPGKLIDWNQIDYCVVATDLYYKEIREYLLSIEDTGCNSKKIIKWYDFISDGPWYKAKEIMPYVSVKCKNEIVYLAMSSDRVIPDQVFTYKEAFSKKNIDLFNQLSEKYYPFNYDDSIWLDLGANIGTESIYVKKLHPKMKVIAVEAHPENYKLLRCNCILNDMDDIMTANFALSDEEDNLVFGEFEGNMGGSSFVIGDKSRGITVKSRKLDDFLEDNNIHPEDINYIWMDTEGFEPKVLNGMNKLLSDHKVALWIEYSPWCYVKNGTIDLFHRLIANYYDKFIDINKLHRRGIENIEECIYSAKKIGEYTRMYMEKYGESGNDLFFF